MAAWTDGPRLVSDLRNNRAPMRMTSIAGWVRKLGFTTDIFTTCAAFGIPLSHRGIHVGNLFVGAKDDKSELTSEDEEILTLFATHAAAVILKARTYQAKALPRTGLEVLFDSLSIGIAVVDAQTGVVRSFNREMKRIFESPNTPEVPLVRILKSITCRLVDGRELVLDQYSLAQMLAGTKVVRAEEVEISIPGGRDVDALVNVTPIQSTENDVELVVVTVQDLAPFKELERQCTAFLDIVSHELRAPLTAIIGSATTLKGTLSTIDSTEMSAFLRIIIEQSERMRGLISDLLNSGRIEAGTLSVSPEPTEVAILVDGARNSFMSSGRRHATTIDLESDLPRVMADRSRIQQVLTNLLSNAARLSPDTTPVRISASRTGSYVEIAVRDEGRGIAPDRLSTVFQKLVSSDTDDIGRVLSLAICKGLVEAHGGHIRAESDGIGQGSCFTFTLPIVQEVHYTSLDRSEQRPSKKKADEPTRVLVVDDDPLALRFVRETLSEAGYTVRVTGDHQELPELIKNERPDLVLLDLVFPDTDGIELLKQNNELASLPVIFISGYSRDATIARALDSGALDYIVKPFSSAELVARIRSAMRGRGGVLPFVSRGLTIHYDQHRVSVDGETVELTDIEFELLRTLSRGAGRVMTYDILLHRVWRGDGDADLVRTFVRKLRRKLGDDSRNPRWIFNQRDVGYSMALPDDASVRSRSD